MSNYTPTPIALTDIPVWDLSTIANGTDMSAPLKALANGLAHLQQQIAALDAYAAIPFAALPYPTIATADHRATLTPAAATNGGTVTLSAGIRLVLAEPVDAATGRVRAWVTVATTTADLGVSSTYYLRAHVVAGALSVYIQKGTDADPIPSGLLGTPGGASGGGFDSTALDLLLARIVTGTAGTVPTVTALANAATLSASAEVEVQPAERKTWSTGGLAGTGLTLNWGRRPRHAVPALQGFSGLAVDNWDSLIDPIITGAIKATEVTRYECAPVDYVGFTDGLDEMYLRIVWSVMG